MKNFFHTIPLNACAGLISREQVSAANDGNRLVHNALFIERNSKTPFLKRADYRLKICPLSRRKYKHEPSPAQEWMQIFLWQLNT